MGILEAPWAPRSVEGRRLPGRLTSRFMKPKPVSREMVTRGVHHDVIGISSAFQLQAAKAKDPEVRVQFQADDGVH